MTTLCRSLHVALLALAAVVAGPLFASAAPAGYLGPQSLLAASVSVIDTASRETKTIRLPNGSTSVRGLCLSQYVNGGPGYFP